MLKISIITICYNNEKDIRATIESVINQTYDNIEYIIVDGESKDNTLNIVKEYSNKISKIISEPDEGLYDAINKGIKESTGDIVGLIHGGDRLFDNHIIGKISNHFVTNDIDAMYGHCTMVNSNNKTIRVNKNPKFNKKLFRFGWMPFHQGIYIKRDLFEKLGYYRLDIGYNSDYEFILRYFYFNNLKIKKLDEYVYKFSSGGISTRNYLYNIKLGHLVKKCWRVNNVEPPMMIIQMKFLCKIPQFLRAFIWNMKMKSYHYRRDLDTIT